MLGDLYNLTLRLTNCKPKTLKTEQYWRKGRHMRLRNRIKNLEINSYNFVPLVFNKDTKIIQWEGAGIVFSKMKLE